MPTILHLDSSGRQTGSLTRRHSAALAQSLAEKSGAQVIHCDLCAAGLPFVNEEMIGGYFTPAADRTASQSAAIQASDALVAELAAADEVVIGLPIYNFHVPAVFKAWADQVARMGVSFTFNENGPVGLLKDRPVHVVLAYGGTTIGSEMDYATPWLKAFLGFLGIKDVRLLSAPDLEKATA
jgi:FMN-dependent NADH-azoreductase